jgi:predicted nucleic acid-binding protein
VHLNAKWRKRKYFLVILPVEKLIEHVVVIDGDQDAALSSIGLPFADLLIGATALSLGFSVPTVNLRHFRLVPGLKIVPF